MICKSFWMACPKGNARWYWPSFPLRLVLGVIMLVHGVMKFQMGVDVFAGMLDGMGIPLAGFFAWVVTLLEAVGGVALIVGALPVVVSGLFIINFLVATWVVIYKVGMTFVSSEGVGYEYNLLILGAFITLFWFAGQDCKDGCALPDGKKK